MYNLIKYIENYRKATGSLWNYYVNELNPPAADNYNADPITNSESFKCKTSIVEKTAENDIDGNNAIKNVEIVIPLKHLNSFWKTLDMPLINCEVSLTLTWSKNCVLTDMITAVAGGIGLLAIAAPTNATSKVTCTKLYVPVVALSVQNDNKFREQLKIGFKRIIKSNKYRSEMTNQAKTDNLSYLVDPAFTKVNRLFVLSFENEEDGTSFSKYYTPKIEIKDFNVLVDGKSF